MKKILILTLIALGFFEASAQNPTWQQIFGNQRFQTALGLPVRDTITRGSNDTSNIVIRPQDGILYYRRNGAWIRASAQDLSNYVTLTGAAQTITSEKTFQTPLNVIAGGSGGAVATFNSLANGGNKWHIGAWSNVNDLPRSFGFYNELSGKTPLVIDTQRLQFINPFQITWTVEDAGYADSGYPNAGFAWDSLNRLQVNNGTYNSYADLKLRSGIFTDLAGTGTRIVFADNNGKLSASETLTGYLLKADSLSGGYTTWDLTKKKVDSLGAIIDTKGSGTVTSVAASAGTGISVSGSPITSSGTITITNTAPDQTVTLTAGSGISVTGTYPNFTVANTSPSSGGTVTSVSAGTGMSFTTITSSGSVNADTTVLATRAYASGLDVAKANTSLNNVNGVLSSTYGGAGSVSGILKANGSGVVSAAVNNTDYTLLNGTGFVRMSGTTPSYVTGTSSQFVKADGSLDGTSYATAASLSGYLPLSGGTMSGVIKISGTDIGGGTERWFGSDAGAGIFLNTPIGSTIKLGSNNTPSLSITSAQVTSAVPISGTSLSMSGVITGTGNAASSYAFRAVNGTGASGTAQYYQEFTTGSTTIGRILRGNGASGYVSNGLNIDNFEGFRVNLNALGGSGGSFFVTGGRAILNSSTDNGTDALQVAGSGLFQRARVSGSSNSGSGSVFPRFQVENTLATQGDGSSTFNFADIRLASGNAAVEMYLSTTFASGATWEPAGIINVATAHPLKFRTSGTDRLTIASTGAATFSSLSGSGDRMVVANSSGTLSTQAIPTGTATTGTYTPTISSTTNIASVDAVGTFRWVRVGNIVTVSGSVSVTPTNTSSTTGFYISLPIASTFSSMTQASGTAAFRNGSAQLSAPINSVNGGTTANMVYHSLGTIQLQPWYIIFQYEVL